MTGSLWLLVASATLVESYAYRYAGAVLVLIAFYRYAKATTRPTMDWRGWLCIGWGVYALGRFSAEAILLPGHPVGDREILFGIPLVFPLMAFIFFQCWQDMERIAAVYFGIAFLTIAATTHYQLIFAGETVRPLIQHNQIHGAVCCGIILIGAAFWMLHYLTIPNASKMLKLFSTLITPPLIVLCLIGIYGAKSKGVWLALGLSSPAIAVIILRYLRLRTGVLIIAGVALTLAAGVYAVRGNLDRTAGQTIASTVSMLQDINRGKTLDAAVSETIDARATPLSMDERLQLWSNAWEVFSAAPIFGWGNEWIVRWRNAHYTGVTYTLTHNGYLEILVRYGLAGAAVFSIMLFAFCRSIYQAASATIVPRAVMHAYFLILLFFAFTLLSNSNNRLAIGESIAIVSSAFALACELKRLRHSS
ncbi:O-antigen ligase family protein [Rhizobium tubonense]|uniref:O-antigen ligase family protein n=1 Tax=Rhizobium tubonense TaxID=484088 RepID=UPI0018A823DC|nr:O-antigen ligase family protein [Rhizobium tubonense]